MSKFRIEIDVNSVNILDDVLDTVNDEGEVYTPENIKEAFMNSAAENGVVGFIGTSGTLNIVKIADGVTAIRVSEA